LKGYVRNLPNGDVEAVALLEENGLYDYLALLKEGSMLSEVSDIDIYEYDGDIVSDFEIRY
jgi:acylphosphatase